MTKKSILLLIICICLTLGVLSVIYNNQAPQWSQELEQYLDLGSHEPANAHPNINDNTYVYNTPSLWRKTMYGDVFLHIANSPIAQWNNYIFFNSSSGSEEPPVITKYNLQDGTSETIFVAPEARYYGYIYDIEIINNTLLFAYGYGGNGSLYKINLSYLDEPQIIFEKTGSIKRYGDNYWLISGSGDVCWSNGTYHLINLQNYSVKEVFRYMDDCSKGNRVIAVDNERVVMVDFKAEDDGSDTYEKEEFTSIYSFPITDPNNKKQMIPSSKLIGIKKILYSENGGDIYLVGTSSYRYNLKTNSLSAVPKLSDEEVYKIETELYRQYENQIRSLSLSKDYYIKESATYDIDKKIWY